MAQVLRLKEARDDMTHVLEQIAVRARALSTRTDRRGDDYLSTNEDSEANSKAYGMMTNEFKRGKLKGFTIEELRAMMREVLSDNP